MSQDTAKQNQHSSPDIPWHMKYCHGHDIRKIEVAIIEAITDGSVNIQDENSIHNAT